MIDRLITRRKGIR